jgi:hypothetical protein
MGITTWYGCKDVFDKLCSIHWKYLLLKEAVANILTDDEWLIYACECDNLLWDIEEITLDRMDDLDQEKTEKMDLSLFGKIGLRRYEQGYL